MKRKSGSILPIARAHPENHSKVYGTGDRDKYVREQPVIPL